MVQQGTQREALTIFFLFFYQMPKVSIENKNNTYSVSKQKDRNRHGPSKQFGPKLQWKKIINKK